MMRVLALVAVYLLSLFAFSFRFVEVQFGCHRFLERVNGMSCCVIFLT